MSISFLPVETKETFFQTCSSLFDKLLTNLPPKLLTKPKQNLAFTFKKELFSSFKLSVGSSFEAPSCRFLQSHESNATSKVKQDRSSQEKMRHEASRGKGRICKRAGKMPGLKGGWPIPQR